jgi:Ca2+-dependent lipid-binding protein
VLEQKTLNPLFKAGSGNLVVSSLYSTLLLTVFDHDQYTQNDFLGQLQCDLSTLAVNRVLLAVSVLDHQPILTCACILW